MKTQQRPRLLVPILILAAVIEAFVIVAAIAVSLSRET